MAFRRALVPFVLAVLVALVYWPGLYGFWGRDDFMQLAFARLVGSPWPLFVHDHYFPVPGSIFRPLGFASFWLWQALFGTDYFANAFGDMLLHIAVSFALFRVIRASGLESIAGCCFARSCSRCIPRCSARRSGGRRGSICSRRCSRSSRCARRSTTRKRREPAR